MRGCPAGAPDSARYNEWLMMARRTFSAVFCMALCGWSVACKPGGDTAAAPAQGGMQQPLTSFRQVVTSSKTDLQLHPGQDTTIPVRIENPGTDTWISTGAYPITVSYKWFKDGKMMAIEGERTVLPAPIGPNQAADVTLRVIAPPAAGKYALRVTLVQEAVAWFMLKSNTFLELPATVE